MDVSSFIVCSFELENLVEVPCFVVKVTRFMLVVGIFGVDRFKVGCWSCNIIKLHIYK